MTMKSEEIFRPIDLEISLGKIEDSLMDSNTEDMDCEPITKTCEQSPFRKESGSIPPFPTAEASAELRERQRIDDSAEKLMRPISLQNADGRQVDWVPEDLVPVEQPIDDDDDDFSITSAEAESLVEENADFEKIEDRVSFWDSGVEQSFSENLYPSTVSFCSHPDASQV